MPVGLLAKLVALLLFVLAAVGVFVGGEKFVSLLDKTRGPAPPTLVRATPESVPQAATEPPPTGTTSRRPAPGVATLTPFDRQPPTPDPMPRPTRGALRPATEPPRPRPTPATPSPERRDAVTPPREEPAPAVPPPVPKDSAEVPLSEPIPAERVPGQSPTGPEVIDAEPVLVDLRIGRLVSRTVVAYRQGEDALIPLGTFFDMAEILATISDDGRLDARLEPSGTPIRIAAGSDSVSVGNRRFPVSPAQLLFREGELYLSTERLGTMLELNFDVSWPDLTVAVLNPDSLPVAQRIRRDQMRMLLAERNGARPDTTLGPVRTKWDGLVLDYDLAFPLSDNLVGGSNYQFALGAQVGGGALEIGVRSLGTLESGETEFAATWKGVWVENKYVKQLTLGTGTLTGPRYAGIRGVAVTNSPYIRPTYVGQLDYYGRLEPGWELEAYSGSQLVAFDSIGPGGDYSLTLPVGYGENPIDFVAYGPYGQVRRFNQTYRVVSEQLPYRQFEYGLAAGECISTLCTSALNADLHYGLSRRVTVRGGVEGYARDSLPDLIHPYAVATGLLGNALTLEGEVVGSGWLRGAARLEPSLNFRLAAGYSAFDDNIAQPVIAPQGRRSQWLFDAFLRPIPTLSTFYFQGLAEIDEGIDLTATRARLQGSVQAAGVRLYPYVRFERLAPAQADPVERQFVGLSAYATGRPAWGPVLRDLWLRGDIEAGGGEGFQMATARIARSFGPELRIEAGAGWRRGSPGTTFTLSLVSYLPSLQATTTAVAPTVGPGGVVQTLQGALIYDETQRRVTSNPNSGLRRSGVTGRLFVDDNANGEPDPGEPGVGGVRVIVGTYATRTDSLGRYHIWNVPAFEPVKVEVDTNTLDNPLYVPAFTSALVSPPPNAYRELNLPLVTGAVLEGRVVREGAPMPGVTLVLTNTSNGKTTSIATFSDGSFYVLGVKPGNYTLEVDARDLSARRLTGSTLQITAQPNTPDQLSNLVVEVRSAPK